MSRQNGNYSFDDIINLSYNLHKFNENSKWNVKKYDSMESNGGLINHIFKQLEDDQKVAFLKLHETISNNSSSISLIDSMPGTGKTHLMALFMLSLRLPVLYTVYKTELMENMKNLSYVQSMTVTKCVLNMFSVNYFKKFNKYDQNLNYTKHDILLKILLMCLSIKTTSFRPFDILIIDEYTILNPEIIISIILYCKLNNKHLIFVGDRCQQNSIAQSQFHDKISNYFLINTFQPTKIILTKILRCSDLNYNEKLKKFRSFILKRGYGETPCDFHMCLLLYAYFRNNFYNKPDYEASYLSSRHSLLTARAKLIRENFENCPVSEYMIFSNNQYIKSPYNGNKFSKYLILNKSFSYIYFKRNNPNMSYGRVKILQIFENKLQIKHTLTNQVIYINRELINRDEILELQYNTLMNKIVGGKLYQYPLIPLYTCTYHNAQGLTLNNRIDINLDMSTCESIYVGLSRVRESVQLNLIESRFLKNLEYNYLNPDSKYYYMINNSNDNTFVEVNTINEFESLKNNKNLKICKSVYVNCLNVEPDSVLIQICKYITNNISIIKENIIKLSFDPCKDIYLNPCSLYTLNGEIFNNIN